MGRDKPETPGAVDLTQAPNAALRRAAMEEDRAQVRAGEGAQGANRPGRKSKKLAPDHPDRAAEQARQLAKRPKTSKKK